MIKTVFNPNKKNKTVMFRNWVMLLLIPLIFSFIIFHSPVAISESLLDKKPDVSSTEVTASILKVTIGLALVIAAIFSSAWFYRRFGNFSPLANDELKVIGGISLGQKEKIVLLQVGEEQLLIGVAPGNIQKIHVMKTPIETKTDSPNEKSIFSHQLGDAMKKWKNK